MEQLRYVAPGGMGEAISTCSVPLAGGEVVTMKLAERGRALLHQIYETEIDLVPNLQTNTLTVRLHHLTQAAHDQAVRHLCQELNATETIFPGTDLKLVYKLGSS